MTDGTGELPTGWANTTFEQIFDFQGGSQPPKSTFVNEPRDGFVRLLQIRDFGSDQFPVYIEDSPRWPKCESHDIMIARYGASLGRVLTGMSGAYNVALVKMIFDRECIDAGWARWFLSSDHFQGPIHLLSRSAQNGFNKKELAPISVSLPPLPEQRRIVARIEALQERSSRAKQALTEVKPLLEQFRQSILSAAFSGRLTTKWRAANPNTEPASVLLHRIRAERRRHWEKAELVKYEGKGKQPPKDWKDKYEELVPVRDIDLPELPEGWCWANVGELTVNHDSTRIPLKQEDRNIRSGPYPYYGAFGVIDGIDDYLFDGEFLLLAEDGKNLLERKRPVSTIATGRFWVNNHAHVMTTLCGIPLGYLECFFNSPSLDLNEYLTGIDQVKLTRAAMDEIQVPLAPLTEQMEILRICNAALSSVAIQIDEIYQSCESLTQLEQSILAKAFCGELVPQDPNDEPAAELLARIRNVKAKTAHAGSGKTPRRKSASTDNELGPLESRPQLSLGDLLRQSGGRMSVDDAQRISGLSHVDFFASLKVEIAAGIVEEISGPENDRYLVLVK